MTQTGGLVVLLAWGIFGLLLAVLAYFLLRAEKDPLQELSAPTVDEPEAPSAATRRGNGQQAHPAGDNSGQVSGGQVSGGQR